MAFKKNIFDPNSKGPFKVSRSKIDLFLECPRCFYLDQCLGVKRPQMPAFTLNSAVDILLKNEFDLLRKKKESHELMKKYNIDAIPFDHPDLLLWRGDAERFTGAKVLDERTNLIVDGLVDDIWINKKGELMIVDYKSTSTVKEISLEDEYKQAYKIQMEIYQWIFRKLGFNVSNTGYFVFANAIKDRNGFDGKLEFDMSIISHKGDSSWVDGTLKDIKNCLLLKEIPVVGDGCEYCAYREKSGMAFRKVVLEGNISNKNKKIENSENKISIKNTKIKDEEIKMDSLF